MSPEADRAARPARGAVDGSGDFRSAVWLYLRSRHVGLVLGGTVGVCVGSTVIGLRELPVGFRAGDPVGAPLWAYMPILVGALIAMGHVGRWPDLERHAARRIAGWNGVFAAAVTCIAAALSLVVAATVAALGVGDLEGHSGVLLGAMTARNLIGWTGLCLIGARWLGAGLSWLPAIAAIFLFEWFGRDGSGGAFSWAFATAAPGVLMSWLVAAGMWVLGVAVLSVDPWRLRALTHRQGK